MLIPLKWGQEKAINRSIFASIFRFPQPKLHWKVTFAPETLVKTINITVTVITYFTTMPALSLHKKGRLRASIIISSLLVEEEEEVDLGKYYALVEA